MKPDFSRYALALSIDNQIIFESTQSRLAPLVECIRKFRGTIHGCVLYDKVVGMAAARLIIYSGFISSVHAGTCSRPALQILSQFGIGVNYDLLVDVILDKTGSGPCPMETLALEITDGGELYKMLLNPKLQIPNPK